MQARAVVDGARPRTPEHILLARLEQFSLLIYCVDSPFDKVRIVLSDDGQCGRFTPP